jgi:hypothetical protein
MPRHRAARLAARPLECHGDVLARQHELLGPVYGTAQPHKANATSICIPALRHVFLRARCNSTDFERFRPPQQTCGAAYTCSPTCQACTSP